MTDTKLKDLLTRWSAVSGLDLSAYFERHLSDVLLTIEDRGSPAVYDTACFKLQKHSRTGRWIVVPIDTDTGWLDHNSLVGRQSRHPALTRLFWADGSEDYQTIVEAMRANDGRDELTEARAERDEALGRVDWWAIHARKLRAERDEAIEQLRQAKAEKLQAVKVLVGADECCGECRAISENESQRRAGH